MFSEFLLNPITLFTISKYSFCVLFGHACFPESVKHKHCEAGTHGKK